MINRLGQVGQAFMDRANIPAYEKISAEELVDAMSITGGQIEGWDVPEGIDFAVNRADRAGGLRDVLLREREMELQKQRIHEMLAKLEMPGLVGQAPVAGDAPNLQPVPLLSPEQVDTIQTPPVRANQVPESAGKLFLPWREYTVTLDADTTTPSSTGPVSNAFYMVSGPMCHVSLYYKFGTAISVGAGNYYFNLPIAANFPAAADSELEYQGICMARDVGSNREYLGVCKVTSAQPARLYMFTTYALAGLAGSYEKFIDVTTTHPFGYSANDWFKLTITYPIQMGPLR